MAQEVKVLVAKLDDLGPTNLVPHKEPSCVGGTPAPILQLWEESERQGNLKHRPSPLHG